MSARCMGPYLAHCTYQVINEGNGTVRHMQAGKADKQPPTHATGDTAHADSTAVYMQRCPHQFKCKLRATEMFT
jgi:hypothetical protein